MEIPYNGRAIIEDNFDSVKIIIPSKRNYFVIVFSCIWLCGWFFGESSAIKGLFGKDGSSGSLFMMVWLAGWTFGGIMITRAVLFQVFGKEIIEIGKGTLSIKKWGDFFTKSYVYDLNESKSFRVQDDSNYNQDTYNSFRAFNKSNSVGTILFDYGMQTIRFAEAMDEAEAKHILSILTSKKLLTAKNFD